ncbi:uncharacterized protein J8A68_005065 [[Candida] subhashii]|uniref:Uncharacterized protein n=1 Tax=[Candida] subhashii TaxID=561895 RepID=A0A8J5UJ04_9ASCO|nr:uncharacterized protein J8A68_005065 [[Candida] subhashii]KAG7661487.1 hypothetical protein J8A68_005065 [[Candida] subhashii]
MSDDFLNSSPSRIDPLLYNYVGDGKSKQQRPQPQPQTQPSVLTTPGPTKGTPVSQVIKPPYIQNQQAPPTVQFQQQTSSQAPIPQPTSSTSAQPPALAFPPSASKFYAQQTNLTGWTPLISKTYSNEQILSFNSTPYNSKKLLQNNISNNNSTTGSTTGSVSNLQTQLNNLTPFNEKTIHYSDFFMDSPLAVGNTPIRELQTITPSKFRIINNNTNIGGSAQKNLLQDPTKTATKRSITQLDTPPRQPHKLSIITKAPHPDENETDEDSDEEEQRDEREKGDPKRNNDSKKYYLQTPSKNVLSDITNAPQLRYETPAKQKLHPPSSPTTIIQSDEEDDDNNIGGGGRRKNNPRSQEPPPSPTPVVVPIKLEPIMGVFSERNKSQEPHEKRKGSSKHRSKSKGHKKIPSSSGDDKSYIKEEIKEEPKGNSRTRNKEKMQAGMNKFQIIFTDVNTLKKKSSKDQQQDLLKPQNKASSTHPPHQPPPPNHHDHSMNITREHSIMSTQNTNTRVDWSVWSKLLADVDCGL